MLQLVSETDTRDAAPKFIKPVEDMLTMEGSAGRFECEVSAMSEPLITWFKGDLELMVGVKYKIIQEDRKYTLVIQDCDIDDIAGYTCKAVNSYGSAMSSANLDVQCK